MAARTRPVGMALTQRAKAKSMTVSSPVGGWNARDSLSSMKEDEAVILKNWFPYQTSVDIRKGYTPWAASLSGYIESLMSYSGSTTNKLFACSSNGTIYNVTSQDIFLTDENGAYLWTEDQRNLIVQASSVTADVTGLTNGRWQYVNYTTAAGSYLRCVNGADTSRVFDGTNWHNDGDGAPYDISGVTSSTLVHINMHKNRIWFVQNGTLKAWYLATGALGGTATAFDLSSVAQRGGYLMAMATWTIDAGYGVDDLAVWITSNGEVIVYRGTDPSSASTWALVGIWNIGSPIGRRCLYKWAGDLLAITYDGIVPMAGALQSSRTNPKIALTDIIQPAINYAISNYASNYGWQLIDYPPSSQLYLNVPLHERYGQEQYVMNVTTKRWARFTGWEAGCWELHNDILYFGGYNLVGRAWDSTSDAGITISTEALQAFNYLGKPGMKKRVTMFKPLFYTTGSPAVFGGVNVDFDTTTNSSTITTLPSLYGLWDSATWDTSLWGPDLDIRKNWNGARGIGNAFAPTLNTNTNGVQIQWINSTLVFEEGGVL